MFKIFNKTYQPIILVDGIRIFPRLFVVIEKITEQIKNLEIRGLIIIKKL